MDSYDRATRLYPALVVLAPVSTAALVFFQPSQLPLSLVSVVAAAGFHLIIMRVIRDRGARAQSELWARWGGNPAAISLRWAGNISVPDQVNRHRRVADATGIPLPGSADEAAAPERADRTYEEAVSRLREITRDRNRYPRVWAELIQYGWARNLYATKTPGIIIAVVVFITSGLGAVMSSTELISVDTGRSSVVAVASALIVAIWMGLITPAWVLEDARRYASALIDAA